MFSDPFLILLFYGGGGGRSEGEVEIDHPEYWLDVDGQQILDVNGNPIHVIPRNKTFWRDRDGNPIQDANGEFIEVII